MALLNPDQSYPCIEDIPIDALLEHGYQAVLIDIDNTLVPRDTGQIPAQVASWIERLKITGLPVCLLSNNWHKTVFTHADKFGLPIVYKAMKPAPFAFFRALNKINASRDGAVIIGDQLLTDVLGARISGIKAILVKPRSTTDLWYTKIFRRIERALQKGD
jgi:HAD superfamily phosphatase (TIGR01668 family)